MRTIDIQMGEGIRVARMIRPRLVFQLSRTRMSFCQPPSSRAPLTNLFQPALMGREYASIRLIEAFNRYARPTASSSRTQMRAPSAGPLLFRPGIVVRQCVIQCVSHISNFVLETSINNRVDRFNDIRCSNNIL